MAGTLLQNIQSLSIEALPMDMPAEIPVDISVLVDFDTTLLVRDVEVPDNVSVLNDPDDTLVRVAPPRLEVETFDDEEGEEGAAAEGEEGDQESEETSGDER
jgi:large subunit ribosomal protein L25